MLYSPDEGSGNQHGKFLQQEASDIYHQEDTLQFHNVLQYSLEYPCNRHLIYGINCHSRSKLEPVYP